MPGQTLPPVLFMYGSQTGNAEHITKGLADEAKKRGYEARCVALNDYTKVQWPPSHPSLLVVVCSSTGDGDAPDNATKFLRLVQKKTNPRDMLSQVHYAALCLGDTNYENFCGGGIKVSQAIKDLGAHEFYPRGLADDGTSLEVVVDPWIAGLWPALQNISSTVFSNLEPVAEPEATAIEPTVVSEPIAPASTSNDEIWRAEAYPLTLPPSPDSEPESSNLPRNPTIKFKVIVCSSADTASHSIDWAPSFAEASQNQPARAEIIAAQCLTHADAVKTTIALTIALPSTSNVSADAPPLYQPGDAIGVRCPNNTRLVDALLARLRLDGSASVSVQLAAADVNETIPPHLVRSVFTVRDLFAHALDLTSLPKKTFFRAIAPYAQDPSERNLLLHLCSKRGSNDYSALRTQAPTLLDILAAFPSCQPPLEILCDQLLPLAPRYYSVASSSTKSQEKKTTALIVFNLVNYTLQGRDREGLCTHWLYNQTLAAVNGASLQQERVDLPTPLSLPVFLRAATDFVLPKEDKEEAEQGGPLVMIGPGTGVAPFIGFLEEWQVRRQNHPSTSLPETWLFYGCRNPKKDFLFRKELEGFKQDDTLSHLSVSCSRADPDPASSFMYKGYVQTAMIEQAASLSTALLANNARVYICGDAKNMVKDVHTALEVVLTRGANLTEAAARLKLQQMKESRHYVVDVWG